MPVTAVRVDFFLFTVLCPMRFLGMQVTTQCLRASSSNLLVSYLNPIAGSNFSAKIISVVHQGDRTRLAAHPLSQSPAAFCGICDVM